MIDNHVHIGWYKDGYHNPKDVWQSELDAGVDEIVVSSTSTCAELYKLVIQEMCELIHAGGVKIHPILWLTPRMFHSNCRWALPYMLKSRVKWKGVKIHSFAHREWFNNKQITNRALNVAKQLNVPVLLHTGVDNVCNPMTFVPYIETNSDLTFILAHGRPIGETIYVLRQFCNTFVDTSFMPAEDVKILCDNGFTNRVLFGTDAPINLLFYKDMNTTEYIKKTISKLNDTLTAEQFNIIMYNNLYQ